MTTLFTKEYLFNLQEVSKEYTIIDYVMESKKMNFHDAVIEISRYVDLKPEYITPKKQEPK